MDRGPMGLRSPWDEAVSTKLQARDRHRLAREDDHGSRLCWELV